MSSQDFVDLIVGEKAPDDSVLGKFQQKVKKRLLEFSLEELKELFVVIECSRK